MIKVIILGSGNVGSHLADVFLTNTKIDLIQVYARDITKIQHLKNQVNITDNHEKLLDADIYIICISDDAISPFSKLINRSGKLLVHTSGSIEMNALKASNTGVFYPLQTFSKKADIDFKNIPICIESNNDSDLVLLELLASCISDHVYILNSEKRKKMHLSAVFVNNFVNHLYHIGNKICEENEVPFEILHPLIMETANKVQTLSPIEAQTGPAKRNDELTIGKQLVLLKNNELEIYLKLTKSIINTYS